MRGGDGGLFAGRACVVFWFLFGEWDAGEMLLTKLML